MRRYWCMRTFWPSSLCVVVVGCAARGPQPAEPIRGSQDPLPDPVAVQLPELQVRAAEKWASRVRFVGTCDGAKWPHDTVLTVEEFELLYTAGCRRSVKLRPSGDAEWTWAYASSVKAPLVVAELARLIPTVSLSYPRDRSAPSFTFAARFADRLQVGDNDIDVQIVDECGWPSWAIKVPRFPDETERFTFELIQTATVTVGVPDRETREAYQRRAAPTIARVGTVAPELEADVIGFHDRDRPWDSRCDVDYYARSVVGVSPLATGWYRPDENPLGQYRTPDEEVPDRFEMPFAVVTRDAEGRCSVHVDHAWGASKGRPEGVVEGPFLPEPYPCPDRRSNSSADEL